MRKNFYWEKEKLDENTSRAKVIGGWIVFYAEQKSCCAVFVPDRDHEWGILKND